MPCIFPGQAHEPKQPGVSPHARRTARLLLPHKDRLHPYVRLGLGVATNLCLAVWVRPQFGHIQDPAYSLINAFQAGLEVAVPCATLLVLAPVFLLGRDIPRLLAIGLSFFPAYAAVIGFGAALSILTSGR